MILPWMLLYNESSAWMRRHGSNVSCLASSIWWGCCCFCCRRWCPWHRAVVAAPEGLNRIVAVDIDDPGRNGDISLVSGTTTAEMSGLGAETYRPLDDELNPLGSVALPGSRCWRSRVRLLLCIDLVQLKVRVPSNDASGPFENLIRFPEADNGREELIEPCSW